MPLVEAQQLLAILTHHGVRTKLTLNGIPVPLPAKRIKTTGVAMAFTEGGIGTNGNWKTQLVGLLEADTQADLDAALKEFADSRSKKH